MIQAVHQQRVCICQHALVQRKFEARMVNTLEQRHGVSRGFADKLLERRKSPEEQFQGAGNPLLELHGVRPLWLFIRRPGDTPNLRHGRESIVQLTWISARLGGITPRDIDADSALAGRVLSRYVVLVVSPRNLRFTHKSVLLTPGLTAAGRAFRLAHSSSSMP